MTTDLVDPIGLDGCGLVEPEFYPLVPIPVEQQSVGTAVVRAEVDVQRARVVAQHVVPELQAVPVGGWRVHGTD